MSVFVLLMVIEKVLALCSLIKTAFSLKKNKKLSKNIVTKIAGP